MTKKIPQHIVDGKVAVLCGNGIPYSTNRSVANEDGYFSHYISEEDTLHMLFDPYVVDIILTGKDRNLIIDHCKETYNVSVDMPQVIPNQNAKPTYFVDKITVEWIPVNSVFTMHIDDNGNESVILHEDYEHPKWIEATQ